MKPPFGARHELPDPDPFLLYIEVQDPRRCWSGPLRRLALRLSVCTLCFVVGSRCGARDAVQQEHQLNHRQERTAATCRPEPSYRRWP